MATAKPAAKPAPAAAQAATDTPEPPKKKSKLFVAIAVVVLLAAAGGGAAWYFLRGAEPPLAAGTGGKEAKHVDTKPPTFVTLEPFTVNLQPEGTERYLQAGIVYQVADQKTVDAMKTYMPIIRNKVLMLLSSKLPSEIAALDGKKKLVGELIAVARESIPGPTPERGIDSAYLSSFVIQ